MIQGPLALDWSDKKWGLLPRLENGDLTGRRPPTIRRFDLWVDAGIHVLGQPAWRFIKLHTHGAQEPNAEMLLGPEMQAFHRELARHASERGFKFYYVTAYEMAALVKQAELGFTEPDFAFACDLAPAMGSPGDPS
jgi:hypothetical protein